MQVAVHIVQFVTRWKEPVVKPVQAVGVARLSRPSEAAAFVRRLFHDFGGIAFAPAHSAFFNVSGIKTFRRSL